MESRVATSTASPLAVLRPGPLTAYWQFQRAVAQAQLAAWLPAGRGLLIDISGLPGVPAQAAGAGRVARRAGTHEAIAAAASPATVMADSPQSAAGLTWPPRME